MPFLRSATRPQAVQCFFCLSPSLLPPHVDRDLAQWDRKGKGKGRVAQVGTKWNWQCDRCGCWNIKDEHGEMISDLPAMHNSTMNSHSFSLRAKPSSSHLPSASSTSPFCHSCLANQTLIMNMLANYLPDDDDPSFPMLYAELPSYLAKLHARYPPVCTSCRPAVDEALRKSDHRAQVEAWGSALKRGAAGSSTTLEGSGSGRGHISAIDVLVWRMRGLMYWLSMGLSWSQGLLATIAPQHLHRIPKHDLAGKLSLSAALVSFHSISVLWMAWDPYWLRRIRKRDRTKVKGRETWVRNMLSIMMLRILTAATLWSYRGTLEATPSRAIFAAKAAFALEVALVIHSLLSIRISQPVPIQLVRPVSLTSSPAARTPSGSHPSAVPHPSSSISALSLGSQQSQRQSNPIFGQPSLQQQAQNAPPVPRDGEPMDWEPSPSAVLANGGWTSRSEDWTPDEDDWSRNKKYDWDTFATNKQRMFPRQPGEDETGLESLLAGWGIGGGGSNGIATGEDGARKTAVRVAANGYSLNERRTRIERISFGLTAIRLTTAGATVLPSVANQMSIANHILIIVELILACTRLALCLQSNNVNNDNDPRIKSSVPPLPSIITIVGIVLRSAALSPFPMITRALDHLNVGNPALIEWLIWGGLDVAGAVL